MGRPFSMGVRWENRQAATQLWSAINNADG